MPPLSPKKYRHKPTEVFAVHFAMDGEVDLTGFPIPFTITPTDETVLDGLLGPMPVFEVAWTDAACFEHKRKIAHNTMILARPYRNSRRSYLDFVDYDSFHLDHEEIT